MQILMKIIENNAKNTVNRVFFEEKLFRNFVQVSTMLLLNTLKTKS